MVYLSKAFLTSKNNPITSLPSFNESIILSTKYIKTTFGEWPVQKLNWKSYSISKSFKKFINLLYIIPSYIFDKTGRTETGSSWKISSDLHFLRVE